MEVDGHHCKEISFLSKLFHAWSFGPIVHVRHLMCCHGSLALFWCSKYLQMGRGIRALQLVQIWVVLCRPGKGIWMWCVPLLKLPLSRSWSYNASYPSPFCSTHRPFHLLHQAYGSGSFLKKALVFPPLHQQWCNCGYLYFITVGHDGTVG